MPGNPIGQVELLGKRIVNRQNRQRIWQIQQKDTSRAGLEVSEVDVRTSDTGESGSLHRESMRAF